VGTAVRRLLTDVPLLMVLTLGISELAGCAGEDDVQMLICEDNHLLNCSINIYYSCTVCTDELEELKVVG
jgi:hypothetical protein